MKYLFFLILILPLFLFADSWIQTDWSGGHGYFQWQEHTGYFEGNGVNGWRKPGYLTLFAPDFFNFYSIGKMPGAVGVYALYSYNVGYYYAGTGAGSAGSAKLFKSSNYGNTWDTTTTISNATYKVQSILIPSFGEIFIGTDPARIYKSHAMGDSMWKFVHSISNAQGTYISSLLEADYYLYASSVRAGNDQAKIYRFDGNNWNEFARQPEYNDQTPAAIYQFTLSEDSSFYAAAYYTNYGAKIFRFLSTGNNWELCTNLPDTTRKPFALDIGNDTTGSYGALYTGMGEDSGIVYRSTDLGDSWSTCGMPPGAWSIIGMIVDKDGTVYAAGQISRGLDFKVKIFRSTDMGLSWDTTATLGGAATNKPTSFYQTRKGFLLAGTEIEGEIFKAAYMSSGNLVSSVYDVGTGNGSSRFGYITWDENLHGQNLGIKVRTDSDSSMPNAIPWEMCPFAQYGDTMSSYISVNNGDRYIQYRVECSTNDIDYSAELQEIQLDYTVDSTAPHIDSAYASDGNNPQPGIDYDDYVMLVFDDSTNAPQMVPAIINDVLKLSNGHSWWDDSGFVYVKWVSAEKCSISWPGLVGAPSVAVGDTIYPDTSTIVDRWGNPCKRPVVITGSFDPPGVVEERLPTKLFETVTIFPSIARNTVNVQFEMLRTSKVSVCVFDISGRLVKSIEDK
ncbi:MAG: hypothetical protein E3J78_01680, partial [Candidatus Cloacimonadota bacterium]